MNRFGHLALVACVLLGFCSVAQSEDLSITLTVDYGDGVAKVFQALPYQEGMTVADATQLAVDHPRGIQCDRRGRGQTALLIAIDGLKNQGATGLNWIFSVNETLGERSFGVVTLKAGDNVLWKFDQYR